MVMWHKYDEEGYWIPGEDRLVDDESVVLEGYTSVPVPIPNWNPVFDIETNTWIETASEEETNPPSLPYQPTEIDEIRIALAEMDLMRVRDKTEMQLALAEAINAMMGVE